jgi:sporulation protein YlmC with PRC-barrel domain
MRRPFQFTIGAAAASALAFVTLGQDAPSSKADQTASVGQAIAQAHAARPNDTAKASDILGMEVKNDQNEKLGKAEDIAFDVESGLIVQVIISGGGGKTMTAPSRALHRDLAGKFLRLDASWISDINATPAGIPPRPLEGTIHSPGAPSLDKERDAEIALSAGRTNASNSTGKIANPPGGSNKTETISLKPSPGNVRQLGKLIGASVASLPEKPFGKVENFVVDLSAGRIIALIISSGRLIGAGGELTAVPPAAFRFSAGDDVVHLKASMEVFADSPHFKSDEWPDFGREDYIARVCRAYKVEPNITPEAGGALQGPGAGGAATLALIGNGGGDADTAMTAQVWKEILDGKGMSANAKKVKIITIDGRVTLRGPVDSDEEKRLIGEIAIRLARSGNVENQLEVVLPAGNNK